MLALPQHVTTELFQILHTAFKSDEMVSCELPDLAAKATGTVGHQDFRFAYPVGVNQKLTRMRVASLVLARKWCGWRVERNP